MKKIYRILFIISVILLVGIIFFFSIKINPKIKTKLYKYEDEFLINLNTNQLDKKTSAVIINNKQYKADFLLTYHDNLLNIYFINIYDLNYEISDNCDISIYTESITLIKYLMK